MSSQSTATNSDGTPKPLSICDRWEVLVLISAVMIAIAAISQVAYAADSTGVASWTASFGETAPVAGGGRR